VLDDCYNANPASMAAALHAVQGSASGGAAYAVLGDMLELGPEGDGLHHEIGALVAKLGFVGLVAVGPMARGIAEGARATGLAAERIQATEDAATAASTVLGWSQPGDWILVKASRGLRLERVLEAMLSPPGAGASAGR
jgi:UDP-N-acetylmuramoyl-tripeptide--D-alanyl-D-alanine ligase